MIQEVMVDANDRMSKAIEALQNDLKTIRTWRAAPALGERGNPTRTSVLFYAAKRLN